MRIRWSLLTFYQKFEHGVITLLTVLIAFVIALAVWNLMLKVVNSVIYANFDPTDYEVFQALFPLSLSSRNIVVPNTTGPQGAAKSCTSR